MRRPPHPKGWVIRATTSALCLALVGCGGDSSSMSDSPATTVTLTVPPTAEVNIPVDMVVQGRTTATTFVSINIDYDGNGIPDDSSSIQGQTFEKTWVHQYADEGTYTVETQVFDAVGIVASKSSTVTVSPSAFVQLTYTARAVADVDGECYAIGPMMSRSDLDGIVRLTTTETQPLTLGSFTHADVIPIGQRFFQQRFNEHGEFYGCEYSLQLYAGEPGKTQLVAGGKCQTTSRSGEYNPALWTCIVSQSWVVP